MSELLDNIKRIIEKSMKENNIPGAAVAVIQNQEIILSEGFGCTTVEDWGSPIRKDTLFRIASVSKLFTGTVIMMLAENGLLDLDKPVQSYVPWFTAADPELSKLITIRMLLSHSSGLPTGGALSFHYKENGLYHYMKEVVPTLPILFYPGSAYSYGNHGLNIAGFVAEQVTQKSFAELMQEMLFDQLEMTQTTYHPLKAMTFPLAMPHDQSNDGSMAVSHQFFDNSASYPSYYAFSSIEDLSRFALMHLKDGVVHHKQLLSSLSIKEMRTEQSKWYTSTDAGCGITFFREIKNGVERFWHYGQYSHQYSSQFILVPEKGIAVIALANGENIFQAGYEIVDELLKEVQLVEAFAPSPSEQPDWSYYQGTYLHSYYGIFHLVSSSEKVCIKLNEQSYELIPFNENTYFAKDQEGNTRYTIGFPKINEEQTIKTLMINSHACPEFTEDYHPNPEEWKCWEGIYDDGRESYEVRIHEQSLIIKDLQSGRDLEGQALAKNLFLTKEFGLVDFIEIDGVVTLEFGYAWRFKKKSEL